MAQGSVRDILRVPGQLCLDPTDLSIDFPHGGTAIGIVRDIEFRYGIRTGLVTAEEWGSTPVETVFSGESAVLACVLREWDDDAINSIFLNTTVTTGFAERRSVISRAATDGKRAGALLSSKSSIVCFSPLALNDHPMLIVRKGIPLVDESAMLQASLAEEFGVAVVWQAIPDATFQVYDIGRRGDLVL